MLEMPRCLQIGATRAVVESKAIVSDLAPDMNLVRSVSRVETMPEDVSDVEDAVVSMDPPRGMRTEMGSSRRWLFFVESLLR